MKCNKILGALTLFLVLVAPLNASAVNVDLGFDYRTFNCPGCYKFDIVDYTNTPGFEYMLGLFFDSDGDLSNGQNRTNVYYNAKPGSALYLDTANNTAYIAAGASAYTRSNQPGGPNPDFFETDVQIYMQYTSGVSIQTDATGTPVGINVAGTHAANAGYVVWDETFYAAFGTAKTNAAGLSATGFGVDGKYSSWLQGIASFLNTDGSPNTALGELFVKGDFHFNTNFAGRTEVPEPFTAALLGSALLGGCALRRKKQSI